MEKKRRLDYKSTHNTQTDTINQKILNVDLNDFRMFITLHLLITLASLFRPLKYNYTLSYFVKGSLVACKTLEIYYN